MAFVNFDNTWDCNCDGGNDGTLASVGCNNDETGNQCLEVKVGQGMKLETAHTSEALSEVTLRLMNESVMEDGALRISPYDTSTEILDTNGVDTPIITGAETNDVVITDNMMADMATGNPTNFRIWDGAGQAAKIKMAEVDIEFTLATIDLIAESRDDDDNIVGSVGVVLLQRSGSFPYFYTQVDSATTNGSGLHTFSYEDAGAQMRIFYMKE